VMGVDTGINTLTADVRRHVQELVAIIRSMTLDTVDTLLLVAEVVAVAVALHLDQHHVPHVVLSQSRARVFRATVHSASRIKPTRIIRS
jgi:hypothetical protein